MSLFFRLALETCNDPSMVDGYNFVREPLLRLRFGTVPFRGESRL